MEKTIPSLLLLPNLCDVNLVYHRQGQSCCGRWTMLWVSLGPAAIKPSYFHSVSWIFSIHIHISAILKPYRVFYGTLMTFSLFEIPYGTLHLTRLYRQ
jgi:hypothetical protein